VKPPSGIEPSDVDPPDFPQPVNAAIAQALVERRVGLVARAYHARCYGLSDERLPSPSLERRAATGGTWARS
jgi:hypothetical protein